MLVGMQTYLLLGHTGCGAVDIFARWPPPTPDPAGSCDISPASRDHSGPLARNLCGNCQGSLLPSGTGNVQHNMSH